MSMFHKDAPTGDIHQIHQWTYADATAKSAASGFASSDVGKVALQIDTATYYILTATTPTWQQVGSGDVTTTGTQTLTNKKLSDSTTTIVDVSDTTKIIAFDAGGTTGTKTTITGAQTANRVVTLPDSTDTLVGKATTDTLTNKTMSGASNTFSNIPAGTALTGQVAIANGGTGAASKSAAFDALSPMTTSGDVIYGGASGTGTRLAKGSDGQVLTLASGVPSWATSSTAPDQSYEISNLSLAASVASSALTIALKDKSGADASVGSPVKIGFRNSTATTGTYNQRSVTAALSLVISSGSTLGHASATAEYIYVYAIDNAGTVELAASTSKYIDEGTLVTTTAEGGAGAADSRAVIYSTTARTSVAARLIGRIKSTQATAGTWATAVSEISLKPFKVDTLAKAKYTSATTTIGTSDTDIIFPTKVYDTHQAYNTATGEFTCPDEGFYRITAHVRRVSISASTVNHSLLIQVFKGGTLSSNLGAFTYQNTSTSTQAYIHGTVLEYCSSGTVLKISGLRDANAGSGALDGAAANNYVVFEKVAGQ